MKSLEIVKLLLRHGASPDVQMTKYVTPLHLAAAGGWIEGIRTLAEAGVLLDSKDRLLLETPFHKAARNWESEACRVLIKYGSSP
ncbi:ankyrin repeat-containing domain protein [Penicillium malachiteum]|uniref:ankyrin repeat-containing domain protein n=1 Tax=Penicillium malachiteum TaxID=1324776 RepID=UPI002547893B|nr:ankyrin repeat-containing domain protein [Penicillium malachiteum]KAJ5737885.1 ankyrin repeat-containing domain protein [Penicillium malachiteum]